MKNKLPFLLALFALACTTTLSAGTSNKQVVPSKTDLLKIGRAAKQLNDSLENAKTYSKPIKVVYFHASDQAALEGWQERLPRTLEDVSNFYQEEFQRFGLKSKGLPFERINGKIVIHEIQGDSVSKKYRIYDGARIQREIERKSQGKIRMATDHILVINGLCDKQENGSYSFHSPYYGTGNPINGVCLVADCEKLDTRLLRDTVQKMTYSEMAVTGKTCSVAEFNSWYIGGIAHEMGHIFGLPHDFGGSGEFGPEQTSLMGEYGSRHFRDYLWNGEKTSHFSTASMLQLMSHPLFTEKIFQYKKVLAMPSPKLEIAWKDSALTIKCGFDGNLDSYGVVALFRSSTVSEYLNQSYTTVPEVPGKANFDIKRVAPGYYVLRMLFLFPNSITREFTRSIQIEADGTCSIIDPMQSFKANPKKIYEALQKVTSTPENDLKLAILKEVLNPPAPIDLKTCTDQRLYLSDAQWVSATVGYEKPARNYFNLESPRTFFLELDGKLYNKGLYAHSSSSYIFNLDKKWKTFSATIGLRDLAHIQGSAIFKVLGDGKVLYQSSVLRVNQKDAFRLDVSGVKLLELTTEGTEGHNFNSWSIWVDPLLEK